MPNNPNDTGARRPLVQSIADRLRDRVFAITADARIGGLAQLASELGVGIVTVQQAARILEHEGLLEVRRGPGGGYYGRRPDAATLERGLAAYMRVHPHSLEEAVDMTSLLFIELVGAAAGGGDAACRAELRRFADRLVDCRDEADMGKLEADLQDLLFRMVDRPLFELLTRVTLRFTAATGGPSVYREAKGMAAWIAGRQRIVAAILAGDEALSRFEADRSNRQVLLRWLRAPVDAAPADCPANP